MISELTDQLDQLWRSPELPLWLLLAFVGFFGLVLLVTLLRAERSIANGTLAVITVMAISVVIIVLFRSRTSGETAVPAPSPQNASSLPALACLDDLAGETVLTACERMLFASPDMAASAVAHTALQLSRLKSYGDVATANRAMTPDLDALRRAVERDRYGLVAYVLSVRDRCEPEKCAAYRSLTDHRQIAINMTERTYETAIDKYAANWNAPPVSPGAVSLMAPTQANGKPTNTDFPTASSIPPVSIMSPEPPAGAAPRAPAAPTPAAAPKKQPAAAPKKRPTPAPVPLSPSSTAPSTAPSPTPVAREP